MPNDLAKEIMALISYYGGKIMANCTETSTNTSTHAFSVNYDSSTRQLNESNKRIACLIWISK